MNLSRLKPLFEPSFDSSFFNGVVAFSSSFDTVVAEAEAAASSSTIEAMETRVGCLVEDEEAETLPLFPSSMAVSICTYMGVEESIKEMRDFEATMIMKFLLCSCRQRFR